MQTAAFSLTNYQFDKVSVDLSANNGNNLALSLGANGQYDNGKNSFELSMTLLVFNKGENVNPFISIHCNSLFTFENVKSIDEIPDFFYANSIAIIFPYMRAYTSLISTQANIPGVILPTLNLTDLGVDLKNNTIQK